MPPVAIFSVKKYLPKLAGRALIAQGVYHVPMFRRGKRPLLISLLLVLLGCGETIEKRIHIVRVTPVADPECGAPMDGQNMRVRALGDFVASEGTAQFIALGEVGQFDIARFPSTTRMLEVEVRGSGGALRAIGRSASFHLEELANDAEIPVFMAPLDGVCATGPSLAIRSNPMLVRTGDRVLSIGGLDALGNPSSVAERYDPTTGVFELLTTPLYGDISTLGLLGASVTELAGGQVALIGGPATAYQIYSDELGDFGAPAFYREARGHHASLRLPGDRVFLAGGCSQVVPTGCGLGSELRTTSILDPATGEIEVGPSLSLPRVDGSAWLESEGVIVLVGGADMEGNPVLAAERVYLDGRDSQQIDGISGDSVQLSSGAIWAGFALAGDADVRVLAPRSTMPSRGISNAAADSEVVLVGLNNGGILVIGDSRVQNIRGLDGKASTLLVPDMDQLSDFSAIVLHDGSVLVVGLPTLAGAAAAFVFRPVLTGPFSSSVAASFSSDERSVGLSARDPAAATIPSEGTSQLRLRVGAVGENWVTMSGPRFGQFSMDLTAASEAALILLFGWQSSSEHWKVTLENNREAQLVQVTGGLSGPVKECTASALSSQGLSEDTGPHDISMQWRSGELVVLLNGGEVLRCAIAIDDVRGEVGIGVEGENGESLRLDFVGVDR